MVAIACLAVNTGIGLCYGTFGTLVLHIERHFHADRASVALALALTAIMHGVLAPVIGMMIGRYRIRSLMLAGALLAGAGFLLLAPAGSPLALLLIYGAMIGPGTALMGVIPALTLVNNWYGKGQGKMAGVVMMPLALTVAPMIVAWLLPYLGFRGLVIGTAALYLLALPAFWMIVDKPEQLGLRPIGAEEEGEAPPPQGPAATAPAKPRLTIGALWRDPIFLLMVTGTGIIAGAGVAKSAHFLPALVEQGWDMERAALLLSISGATGMAGSLLFGALADRFSASLALALNGLLQAVVWLILVLPSPFALLVVDAVVIGACGTGLISAKAVLVTRIFGRENYAYVAGISAFTTLPFVGALPPVVGLLRDSSGSYALPFLALIGGFVLAAACFLLVIRAEMRARARG